MDKIIRYVVLTSRDLKARIHSLALNIKDATQKDWKTFQIRRTAAKKAQAAAAATPPINRPKQIRNVLIRILIASVFMYLFLVNVFADSWFGLGFIIVSSFLLILGLTLLLHLKPLAKVLNFPIRIYMGRNNRLLYWAMLFFIVSMTSCITTEPAEEVVVVTQVVASENPDETLERELRAIDEDYKEVFAALTPSAEQPKAEVKQVVRDEKWRKPDLRYWSALWLLLLVPIYTIIAFSDEGLRAFRYILYRWRKQKEVVSHPMLKEVASAALGFPIPPTGSAAAAGAVVGTGTEAVKGGVNFFRDVLKEIFANRTAARFGRYF